MTCNYFVNQTLWIDNDKRVCLTAKPDRENDMQICLLAKIQRSTVVFLVYMLIKLYNDM